MDISDPRIHPFPCLDDNNKENNNINKAMGHKDAEKNQILCE